MMIKQPVLSELHNFISGVSKLHRGLSPNAIAQLVKSSLTLLTDLPAAKHIVFEYFSLVFDAAVGNYMSALDKDPGCTPPDDEAVNEIQDALEELVEHGAAAWSPLISTWSLRLLGQLSDKHSPRRRAFDINSACKMWLGSNAMRSLIGLTAQCFGKLNSAETEACIAALLATFVQHSPHFDWVVARLGSCFPLKVISKILQCGLKGFSGNYNSTLDSEVGILGYLSCSHEKELNTALREMLEAVRTVTTNTPFSCNTIPYILHLAEMSEVLSPPIIDVFLELYDATFHDTLKVQHKFWPNGYGPSDLLQLLTRLIYRSAENGVKILLLLAGMAKENSWCHELLEMVLIEVETKVLEERSCPFFKEMAKDDVRESLWEKCSNKDSIVQQTALRLILLNSTEAKSIYPQSISYLLTRSNVNGDKIGMSALIRLLGGQHGVADAFPADIGVSLALEEAKCNFTGLNLGVNVYENLLYLIQLEKENTNVHLKRDPITLATLKSTRRIIEIWDATLDDLHDTKPLQNGGQVSDLPQKRVKMEPEPDSVPQKDTRDIQIHLIAKLIDQLDIGGRNVTLNAVSTLRLARATVKYFFWSLQETSPLTRNEALQRCYAFFSRQCTGKKAARAATLRELIEGALFYHTHLFGSVPLPSDIDDARPTSAGEKEELLLKQNQRQGIAMIASRSLVLHAGVIGNGPKPPDPEALGPAHDVQSTLLNAVEACCSDPDQANRIEAFTSVALLLVELVSTDVMYNGLPWPDEEFAKVTMERDLQIRRSFRQRPILWSLLGLIAACRPALCFCSVLLRALCASVLHQWRARSVENVVGTGGDLLFVTTQLLKLLSMGQLLPPPLDYLYIVVPMLEPNEIAYVLKECVWNFLKDYVPSPILFGCDSTGLHWRDPTVARPPPQFVDPLRYTMQKNIKRFARLYHQMFCMGELNQPKMETTES